jgi:hypothetical protein
MCIDCVTILLKRFLNTSTLCVCDLIMKVYSTLVMLCFFGDYVVGRFLFLLKICYNFS